MTPRTQLRLAAVVAVTSFTAFGADRSAAAQATLDDIEKTVGFVPGFFKSFPDATLPGTWEEMKGLQMNPKTAIPVKYKELIGLAVSAQVPCKYCIVGHTEFAKANGATQEEVGVAVSEAGLTRHWSTYFNGVQLDETKFRADLAKAFDHMKKMDPNAPPPAPATLTDAASAYREIGQAFGEVPEFMKKFPEAGIVGAWRAMRDVEMNPHGTVPPKYISLIGLAVASQIPCRYCIIADTEFAKAEGATDAEVNEAVAMAAHTRNMSTLLNGMQVDEAAFKNDVARLTKPPVKGKNVSRR